MYGSLCLPMPLFFFLLHKSSISHLRVTISGSHLKISAHLLKLLRKCLKIEKITWNVKIRNQILNSWRAKNIYFFIGMKACFCQRKKSKRDACLLHNANLMWTRLQAPAFNSASKIYFVICKGFPLLSIHKHTYMRPFYFPFKSR